MMCYSLLDPHITQEDNYGSDQITHVKLARVRAEKISKAQNASGEDMQSREESKDKLSYEKVVRRKC